MTWVCTSDRNIHLASSVVFPTCRGTFDMPAGTRRLRIVAEMELAG